MDGVNVRQIPQSTFFFLSSHLTLTGIPGVGFNCTMMIVAHPVVEQK